MRKTWLALAGGAALALTAVAAFPPADYLIWNRTASAPQGLYLKSEMTHDIGAFAVVSADADSTKWIADRGYLAPRWPIIKRVRGVLGDEICREGAAVLINGKRVATALKSDTAGRALPVWSGCFTLAKDEIFLLNEHPRSLDGRYFGATKRDDVTGGTRLLFRTD